MAKATSNKTFGPRQAGFDKDDASTWSKGFMEKFLDGFYKKNPEFFDKAYDKKDGDAVAMVIHARRYGKGNIADRAYRSALSAFPRRKASSEVESA